MHALRQSQTVGVSDVAVGDVVDGVVIVVAVVAVDDGEEDEEEEEDDEVAGSVIVVGDGCGVDVDEGDRARL